MFGKYRGQGVSRIALSDYPYLAWLDGKVQIRPLRDRIIRARKALNGFTSKSKCNGVKDCAQTPTRFSIAYHGGYWLIDDAYAFCGSDKCWDSTGLDGPRVARPIKYDSMLRYALGGNEQQTKIQVEQFQTILNHHAGFNDKKTEQNCKKFIDDLIREVGV